MIDDKIHEQLCAYMDGELPADEARFLERRLASDAVLLAKWERLQLASACMKGHAIAPMAPALPARVAEALAMPVASPRRRWRTWAMAASIAALALVFAPRMLHVGSAPESAVRPPSVAAQASAKPGASPASADFVADESQPAAMAATAPSVSPAAVPANVSRVGVAHDNAVAVAASNGSPADFPLVNSNAAKSWPRAELPAVANDPSIEAYLVRHNQMLANDGLGGFVPYVDVVGSDPTPSGDVEGNSQ